MRREELLAAPPRPAGRLVPLERGWVLPLVGGGSSLLPLGRGWVSPLDGGGSPLPTTSETRTKAPPRWTVGPPFSPLDGGGSPPWTGVGPPFSPWTGVGPPGSPWDGGGSPAWRGLILSP